MGVDELSRELARAYSALPLACDEIARSSPASFFDPRVRALFHAGLELEAWQADDLAIVLRAILGDVERFARLVPVPRLAPLGVRVRLARLLHAIASSAREVGLDAVLGPGRREMFARTLEAVVSDRNRFVSLRAASAAGLLRSSWPELWKHLGLDARDPAAERARATALTSAWLYGDLDLDAFEAEMHALRGNDFALGSAVQAMRLGFSRAPKTVEATLLTWIPQSSVPALASASALAALVDDDDVRTTLTTAVRERASALGVTTSPLLRPWLDLAPETARLLADHREFRRLARGGAALARGRALDLFAQLGAPEFRHDLSQDAAVDLVLFDTTLVRDVVAGSAETPPDAALARRSWLAIVGTIRDRRARRLQDAHVHETVFNEQLRSLGCALDALYDERASAEDAPSDWASLLGDIAKRVSGSSEGVADRNAAIAMAVCLEALVTPADDCDDFLFALGLPRRLLHHLARAFSRDDLRAATAAAVRLRDFFEAIEARAPSSSSEKIQAARELHALAGALADAVGALGARGDDPVALAFNGAAGATVQMLRRNDGDAILAETWALAIVSLERAVADTRARFGFARESGRRDQDAVKQRVIAFFKGAGDARSLAPWPLGPMLIAASRLRGALGRDTPSLRNTVVGDYVVEKELGAGGMGYCLLARLRTDTSGRKWVLKMPRGSVRGSRGRSTRDWFRQEARALLGLASAHPAIVPFVAYQEQGYRSPFLVMGFVPGESIAQRLKSGPMSVAESVRVARAVASGLACAHERNIGHHDVKPDNVVLAQATGDAVLVDWGIAGAEFRMGGGTLGFMPPERYRPQMLDTAAALKGDVFALGCMLHRMLADRDLALPPFDVEDARVSAGLVQGAAKISGDSQGYFWICEAVANDTRLLESRIDRDLARSPRALVDAIKAMIRPEHAARPSAVEVVRALDGVPT